MYNADRLDGLDGRSLPSILSRYTPLFGSVSLSIIRKLYTVVHSAVIYRRPFVADSQGAAPTRTCFDGSIFTAKILSERTAVTLSLDRLQHRTHGFAQLIASPTVPTAAARVVHGIDYIGPSTD